MRYVFEPVLTSIHRSYELGLLVGLEELYRQGFSVGAAGSGSKLNGAGPCFHGTPTSTIGPLVLVWPICAGFKPPRKLNPLAASSPPPPRVELTNPVTF